MSSPDRRGFRITANQVTLARLIPMPAIAWVIYEATSMDGGTFRFVPLYLWTALIVGTIIGCTDFVDGYLARKHGPTVLGGLLDPIADKVFVAFAYLPFADLGLVPAWAVALMFVREFLVTALRSAYEQRGLSLKTSYIAKAKTWTQMQGIGVLVLFPLIGDDHAAVMTGILVAGVALPLVAMAGLWLARRKFWRGAIFMSGSFAGLLAVYLSGSIVWSMHAIMIGVVAITWVSAFDYFTVGIKQLRGRGDLGSADGVRILGGLAVPILTLAVMVETPAPAWPLFVIITFELAIGGLDNLLSHHHAATGAAGWAARALVSSALLGASLVVPAQATPLTIAAAVITVVGAASEFWRGRDYYLDARLRNKAREAAAPAPG
ncbi:MAG: CDP-alcohol phosphatidyltransferase family protein [Kofleriaceae bacterium]|nr:CDP-alcohol phosphatidyltransferase family protein [Kofleriaceae bacterium]MBP6840598.1 CDP-alcohol phosphatidyltransferase family protein [Kofleriaceae bacterium]